MEFETCEIPGSKDYVLEFLEKLKDRKNPEQTTAQKILDKLAHYEQLTYAQLVSAQIIKHLEGELFEIRIPLRKMQYRFFGYIEEDVFYIVHAIVKKTQKTPLKAISLSMERIKIMKYEN